MNNTGQTSDSGGPKSPQDSKSDASLPDEASPSVLQKHDDDDDDDDSSGSGSSSSSIDMNMNGHAKDGEEEDDGEEDDSDSGVEDEEEEEEDDGGSGSVDGFSGNSKGVSGDDVVGDTVRSPSHVQDGLDLEGVGRDNDSYERQVNLVKLYRLSDGCEWLEFGTGYVCCITNSGAPSIVVSKDLDNIDIILESRIRSEDVFERQGESIIMWRDHVVGSAQETEYALSFQKTSCCDAIWGEIADVQSRYLGQRNYLYGQHAMQLQMRYNTGDIIGSMNHDDRTTPYLPPLTQETLPAVLDKLRPMHSNSQRVREEYADLIGDNKEFLTQMAALLPVLETVKDMTSLGNLAEIGRAVLLLNAPFLLEQILGDDIFQLFVGIMEYEPALRAKAEYRNFFQEYSEPQQVIVLPDDLKNQAKLIFRLRFLRDTLVRPLFLDETFVSGINNMLAYSVNELVHAVFCHPTILSDIFALILKPISCPTPGSTVSIPVGEGEGVAEDGVACVTSPGGNSVSGGVIGGTGSSGSGSSCSSSNSSSGSSSSSEMNETRKVESSRVNATKFLQELFCTSRQLPVAIRTSLYRNFVLFHGGAFALAFESIFQDPDCVVEERLAVSDCLSDITELCSNSSASILLSCTAFLSQKWRDGQQDAAATTSNTISTTTSTAATTDPAPSSSSPPGGQGYGYGDAAGYDHSSPPGSPGANAVHEQGGVDVLQQSPTQDGFGRGLARGHSVGLTSETPRASRGSKCLLDIIVQFIIYESNVAVLECFRFVVMTMVDTDRNGVVFGINNGTFTAIFFEVYIEKLFAVYKEIDGLRSRSACTVDSSSSTTPAPTTDTSDDSAGAGDSDVSVLIQEKTKQPHDAMMSSHRIVCELVIQCIQTHPNRMKYFFLRNNFVKYISCVLSSRYRQLHIGPIKVAKAILMTNDVQYERRLIKLDLLGSMLALTVYSGVQGRLKGNENNVTPLPAPDALASTAFAKNVLGGGNGSNGNLVSSCASGLFDMIIKKGSREIISHLVERYQSTCSMSTIGDIGMRLLARYSANREGSTSQLDSSISSSSSSSSSSSGMMVTVATESTSTLKRRMVMSEEESEYAYFLDAKENRDEEDGGGMNGEAEENVNDDGDGGGDVGDGEGDEHERGFDFLDYFDEHSREQNALPFMTNPYGDHRDHSISSSLQRQGSNRNSPPLGPLRSKFEVDELDTFPFKSGSSSTTSSSSGGGNPGVEKGRSKPSPPISPTSLSSHPPLYSSSTMSFVIGQGQGSGSEKDEDKDKEATGKNSFLCSDEMESPDNNSNSSSNSPTSLISINLQKKKKQKF